ncbi:MAG: hypothetical protein OEX08_00215 [Candidatus Nomurabacteria bacterium]|nr:hypothetical protein [Candidatus Nomurabacteria bacterium]
MNKILSWDIYEITTKESSIQGVMLRGRIRKYSLENNITLLTENATDAENTVRFGLLNKENIDEVISFIETIIPDSKVSLIQENLPNPVLSKMKVNKEDRYTI